MADPVATDRARAVAAAVAIALAMMLATLRPTRPRTVPARIAAEQAETWMADCLPGVGERRREAVAAALRDGRLDLLPSQARSAAREWFAPPAGGWTGDQSRSTVPSSVQSSERPPRSRR